jgi:hypothetical protein
LDVWFVGWSKGHFSQMFQSNNLHFSCPKLLIKTNIPLGQCGHFSQVGPYENSHFSYNDDKLLDQVDPMCM